MNETAFFKIKLMVFLRVSLKTRLKLAISFIKPMFLSFYRWCSHEQVRKTLATAGVESLG